MSGERGCGSRVDGGLYLTVPLSENGRPVEDFLIDPVIPWDGPGLRAPLLEKVEDTTHVIMGVGRRYYPFAVDFIEEARVMGISKRLPRNFDPSPLTLGRSKLLLMHPMAIPMFGYEVDYPSGPVYNGERGPNCRRTDKPDLRPDGNHECISLLWPLSAVDVFLTRPKHLIEGRTVNGEMTMMVRTPSTQYVGRAASVEVIFAKDANPLEYRPGLFLKFPLFQFEFVSKSGNVPRTVNEAFESSQYRLQVVPE